MVKVRIIADIVVAVLKAVFKLTGFGRCGDKSVQFNIDCLKIAAIKKIADTYGFSLIIESPYALPTFLDT